MQKVLVIYKNIGKTPLQTVKEFQEKNTVYKNVKLGYAGRLDPMAEGLLLVLVGSENKNREKYLQLNKEYEVDMLLGISTDSFDVLGKIINTSKVDEEMLNKLRPAAKNFIGEITQKYPPFSSKTVQGKPLYWWARKKKLDQISIPYAKRYIYSISSLQIKKIKVETLKKNIIQKLSIVTGNLRQEEIIKIWEHYFKKNLQDVYFCVRFSISCSSGTYIRVLASDIGKSIDCPALVLHLKRTRIGPYFQTGENHKLKNSGKQPKSLDKSEQKLLT